MSKALIFEDDEYNKELFVGGVEDKSYQVLVA